MAKTWYYSNTESQQCGLMQCSVCRKPIEKGDFRYREDSNGFITQHRECSADDPTWQIRDDRNRDYDVDLRKIQDMIGAFSEKWGHSPLDVIGENG